MVRKTKGVKIRVPAQFKKAVDKARLEAGYNNREREKFLEDLCSSEDPLGELLKSEKKRRRGGVDFGF